MTTSSASITFVDQSDAKPISAFISGNKPFQQLAETVDGVVTYSPNWASSPLILSASVYYGAATDVTTSGGAQAMKWWSSAAGSQSSPLGTGRTFSVSSNLGISSPAVTYYFYCEVVDSVTGFITPVTVSQTLSVSQHGKNAVWLTTRGVTNLPPSPSGTKNATAITATLIRGGEADEVGTTYKWYYGNGMTQIDASVSGVGGLFGFVTTGAWPTMPSAGVSSIGTNIPTDGSWSTYNTLVIHEDAVPSLSIFRVDAKSADGALYSTTFTVTDVDDPVTGQTVSSAGDKILNGVGSTTIYTNVFKRGVKLTDLRTYGFTYYAYNKDGNRCGFVDVASATKFPPDGVEISSHTTGSSAQFTLAENVTLVAGDIVKCVAEDGRDFYYEVGTSVTGGKTFSIRTPVSNTWLNFTNFPSPTSEVFSGGIMYLCVASRYKVGGNNSPTANGFSLSQDDIDSKLTIICDIDRI